MDIRPEMEDLVSAFNAGGLCVLHIDLQDVCYFSGDDFPTDQAFDTANKFARDLRILNIANYWVGCFFGSPRFIPLADIVRDNKQLLHDSIDFREDELAIIKETSDVFENKDVALMLNSAAQTVQLYTGVYYDSCFAESLKGALKNKFRVYACLDATDCPTEEYVEFEERFFSGLPQEERGFLTVTTTNEVLSVLNYSKDNAVAKPLELDFG